MALNSRYLAVLLCPAFTIGLGCGDAAAPKTDLPDTEPEAIHQWLVAGEYRNWAAEPTRLPGLNGTQRRVFLNESADRHQSPVGSAGVRELYREDSGELIGWSMLIKIDDGPVPADNWYFYETFDLEDPSTFATASVAAPGCTACHGEPPDVIQTSRLDLGSSS